MGLLDSFFKPNLVVIGVSFSKKPSYPSISYCEGGRKLFQ